MRTTAPLRVVLPLVVCGGALVLVQLGPPAALAPLALTGIAGAGTGLTLLAAGALLWWSPPTPARAARHTAVLAALSVAATWLGGYPVGVALGALGMAVGLGRFTSGRPG
ncbi:DUF6114 domain-containing protein [Streptomyces sp. NBC_01268]|uniref:DUF6114 domain-containing protein n=1 Tax=Streptomyces sp. NBC_01268 TaxID=2903806 RepID=UPI002E301BDB|nr:DUF6114 domain-containing protein [Streptomyces sp. NBC_01268]